MNNVPSRPTLFRSLRPDPLDRELKNKDAPDSELPPRDLCSSDELLTQALERFAEFEEYGADVQTAWRDEFLSMYPELRRELEECLGHIDQLQLFAQAVSPVSQNDGAKIFKGLAADYRLGDYRLIRQVGKGGMGVVYEAEHITLGQRVALKVLLSATGLDPRALARFVNEVQAAALLEHPHIVGVFGVGLERGIHFYTMRFITGRTLAELINTVRNLQKTGSLPPQITPQILAKSSCPDVVQRPLGQDTRSGCVCSDRTDDTGASLPTANWQLSEEYFRTVAFLGVQAATGLDYAHQQGVVHRDIKPSNLMLDDEGKLWITDFGLARIENSASLTVTGDLLGTLRFMSPEQIKARPGMIDHRSDIYSLGATLYEMASLWPLIRATAREDILQEVLHKSPLAPRSIQANFPRDLETILLKAVAKDPNDRYASGRDLAEDLQRFIDHRPVKARPTSLTLRGWRWAQHNPQLAKACAIFLLIGCIGFMFGAWWLETARRRSELERTQREIHQAAAQVAERNLALHGTVSETIIASQAWHSLDYSLLNKVIGRWRQASEDMGFERKLLTHIAENRPAVLNEHSGEAYCVKLSHNERFVASSGSDGVRIVARSSGKQIAHLALTSDVNGCAWSTDDSQLACVGDDGWLRIYRCSDWQNVRSIRTDGCLVQVAFAPDSHWIVACERPSRRNGPKPGNRLHIWDTSADYLHHAYSGPTADCEGLALSIDGRLAAVAARDDHVYIWDLVDRKLLHSLHLPSFGQVTAVAFANGSNQLIAGGRGSRCCLIDAATGQILQTLDCHAGGVETVAIAPDDSRISIGGRRGLSQVFEKTRDGRWVRALEFIHQQGIWNQAFSSDGLLFVAGRDGLIEYFDCNLAVDRRRIPISTDLMLNDGQVEGSRAVDGHLGRSLERHLRQRIMAASTVNPAPITQMALSPDGQSVAITNESNELLLCSVGTGAIIARRDLDDQTGHCLAFSSSGRRLAALTSLREIRLFEVPSLKQVTSFEGLPVGAWHTLAFCQDDRAIVTTLVPYTDFRNIDHSLLAFDSQNLRRDDALIPRPLQGGYRHAYYTPQALGYFVDYVATGPDMDGYSSTLSGKAFKVAFASQARTLACLFQDNTIRVLKENQPTQPLVIHGGMFACHDIAVSPDGALIAVTSLGPFNEGLIRLFHTATGRELFSIQHHLLHLASIAFTPDGNQLIAAGQGISGTGELVIWGQSP